MLTWENSWRDTDKGFFAGTHYTRLQYCRSLLAKSYLVFSSASIWQFSKMFLNKPSVGKYKNSICHQDSYWIPKPQLPGEHPALSESLKEGASKSLNDQAQIKKLKSRRTELPKVT